MVGRYLARLGFYYGTGPSPWQSRTRFWLIRPTGQTIALPNAHTVSLDDLVADTMLAFHRRYFAARVQSTHSVLTVSVSCHSLRQPKQPLGALERYFLATFQPLFFFL